MLIAPIRLNNESVKKIFFGWDAFLLKNFAAKMMYKMSNANLAISHGSSPAGKRYKIAEPEIINNVSDKCGRIFNSFTARQFFPFNCIIPRSSKSPKLKNAQKTCREVNMITPNLIQKKSAALVWPHFFSFRLLLAFPMRCSNAL